MGARMLRLLCVSVLCAAACAPGTIEDDLSSASDESGVPTELLHAVGWAATRLTDPGPADREHDIGARGVMGLVERPDADRVGEAAALLGVDRELVANDRRTNIRGAAALLRAYAGPEDDWRAAVIRLSAIPDEALAAEHADQVFGAIEATGPIRWMPASTANYTHGRAGESVRYVVIHTTQGSYAGAISWLQNPAAQASAHYVIRASDGQITQMVDESDTAWHAGNWTYNLRSVGIEHEGFVSSPSWTTGAMLRSSAELTCAIARRHGIPLDRDHIFGHVEVPLATHTDPGPYWDWPRYMGLVRAACDATPDPDPDPAPSTGCPWGDGLYCGGNGVAGAADTLYRCRAGALSVAEVCVSCESMPAGTDDRCAATACPYGDGLYCGGNGVGGFSRTLYSCQGGEVSWQETCASSCVHAPPGVDDHCD
jgi:hypothetical protein